MNLNQLQLRFGYTPSKVDVEAILISVGLHVKIRGYIMVFLLLSAG